MPKIKLSESQYAELGKAVERVVQKDYLDLMMNKKRLIGVSLLKGTFVGFGGVLGATVLIGILIWLLSLFGELPWLGDFFKSTRETIQR